MANLFANLDAAILAAIQQAFPAPTPQSSWISYDCYTQVECDSGLIVGATLPSSPLIPTASFLHWDALNSQDLPTGNPPSNVFQPIAELLDAAQTQSQQDGSATVFTQQQSVPLLVIYLVGSAVRVGYPIPVPEIVSFGGVVPKLANRLDCGETFRQGIVGMTDFPVYGAGWRLRYVLEGSVLNVSLPVPPNPILG